MHAQVFFGVSNPLFFLHLSLDKPKIMSYNYVMIGGPRFEFAHNYYVIIRMAYLTKDENVCGSEI